MISYIVAYNPQLKLEWNDQGFLNETNTNLRVVCFPKRENKQSLVFVPNTLSNILSQPYSYTYFIKQG